MPSKPAKQMNPVNPPYGDVQAVTCGVLVGCVDVSTTRSTCRTQE